MLLTISTTYQPATDLGYLLHKNPSRVQSFSLSFGAAHVFYPEATEEHCTAALLLDVDPVQLVRGKENAPSVEQYVNDRPYVASSFLSVALAEVFGTALNGRCTQRPELADTPLPLKAELAAIACRSGEQWLRRLFEPLGYTVSVTHMLLDEQMPEWGESPYYKVTIEQTIRLSQLLTHLYVIVPVLDNVKHYWIGNDEVEKLLRRGQGWLENHPEREVITTRYLRYKRNLIQEALARLIVEEQVEEEQDTMPGKQEEQEATQRPGLHQQRLEAVLQVLRDTRAKRVLDLGCGEGRLLKMLLQEKHIEQILGMDVSYRTLEIARRRLNLERLPERQRARISLLHGSLTYRDKRLEGYDAAAVVEVIEHLDEARLATFERVLFECARPGTVIITTPNAEYNVRFETLPAGKFRHLDHRFEWTRAQFQHWAEHIATKTGYTVHFQAIGEEDNEVGAPSQMAIFTRATAVPVEGNNNV